MSLVRASNFCWRSSLGSKQHLKYQNDHDNENKIYSANQQQSLENLKVKVHILSSLCSYCRIKHNKRRRNYNRKYHHKSASNKDTPSSNRDGNNLIHERIPLDIFSTIYTSSPELLIKFNSIQNRHLFLLSSDFHSQSSYTSSDLCDYNHLSVPVHLQVRSKKCQCRCSNTYLDYNKSVYNDERINFSVYVPPCIAANIGIYEYAPSTSLGGVLSILSNESTQKEYIRYASTVFLREVAQIPKIFPINLLSHLEQNENEDYNSKETLDCDKEDEISLIQNYFLSNSNKSYHRKKIEERMLQKQSIFAVSRNPILYTETSEFSNVPWSTDASNTEVRFYEVVHCTDGSDENNEFWSNGNEENAPMHENSKNHVQKREAPQETEHVHNGKNSYCYIVSPKKTKLILLTSHSEKQPCLPSLRTAHSFFSSITRPDSGKIVNVEISVSNSQNENGENSSTSQNRLTQEDLHHLSRNPYAIAPNEQSTKTLVDKLLLCSYQVGHSTLSLKQVSLPLLHVSGKDEHDIKLFVENAADVGGMRYIHIDGLSAFLYRVSRNRSNNITGSIINKLDGIQHALEFAKRSCPCVLHFCNFHLEIGGINDEEKADELKRLIARIRKGFTTLEISNKLVVILSSSGDDKLLSSCISEISPHCAINVDYPHSKIIEFLWSDEETFEDVKPYLNKLSTSEILYVREQYFTSYNELAADESGENFENIVSTILKGSRTNSKSTHNSLIPSVHWKDIGGLAHVRDEIKNTVELPLQYPHLFSSSHHHRFRSGLLLYGPPGTGKTLVAKAVATEYSLPFLSIKGPELLGTYVGESEGNVREVFSTARRAARDSTTGNNCSVLFFDELDSLAPKRSTTGDSPGGGVMERVVSTLLSELDDGGLKNGDDMDGNEVVFVFGATNRPDLLDPSLLRPGRFDRKVYLGLAKSNEDRGKILCAQMRKFTFENNRSVKDIVSQIIDSIPDALSGADLSSVASGALMRSIRRLCTKVEKEALQRYNKGEVELNTEVNDIMKEWEAGNKDNLFQLEPIVTIKDVKEAAKDVIPSVNEAEIRRYENMKTLMEEL